MHLQMTTGQETFQGASAKVAAFLVIPPTTAEGKPTEVPLFNAVKDGRYPVREFRKGTWHDAGEGVRSELGGWYTNAVYDLPAGSIVKLFAMRTEAWNRGNFRANVFLLMREDAAFQRIACRLSGHSLASFATALIEGRFDVLSLEEAEAEYNIHVLPAFRRFHDETMISRVMDIEVMQRQANPRQRVEVQTLQVAETDTPVVIRTRRRRREISRDA